MKTLAACVVVASMSQPGFANCRHALALGLDVSGSVDEREYHLQLDGLATALQSTDVSEILFRDAAAPIHIAVYEWSGPDDQTLILPWIALTVPIARDIAIDQLRSTQRTPAASTTAIGAAMRFGASLLSQQPDCWRHTLDISGDGEANTGPHPSLVEIDDATLIINGLVIGSGELDAGDHRFADIKQLSSYYESHVTRGAGAFVETALGFESYAESMERKLIRELQSVAIGNLP